MWQSKKLSIMKREYTEMRDSVKNQIDMLIFHKSYLYDFGYIVPQASQSSLYRRTESEIQFAIPSALEMPAEWRLV